MNYEITIFGLLIINLMNWLDGVLTYIGLYIISKYNFSELNNFNWYMFNSVGWFNTFAFKIVSCIFVTLILFYLINISIKERKNIANNIFIILFVICFLMITIITFRNAFLLINYYL